MTIVSLSQAPVFLTDLKGDISSVEVLIVYGIEDGAIYQSLQKWLREDPSRYLIFIEDNEERFLQMKELKDPKLRLYFYQEDNDTFFKEIAWEFVFLKFSYAVSQEYAREKVEKMNALFFQLHHYHEGVNLLASDSRDMGAAVFKNILQNQKHLAGSVLAESLRMRCKGIPAVICGAGGSLDHALDSIQSLGDRALIFAGGSAVTTLSTYAIRPHFCAHFDPNPPRERFLKQDVAEVPHFYQSRFSSGLLDTVHAPLIWVAEGGSYPIEHWIKEQYGIDAPSFDGGWTVANLCTALAIHLGCDPIIFVGMDFSVSEPDAQDSWVEVENGLYTKRDWLMSVEWLSAFAKQHSSIRILNATKAGLEIPGVDRIALDEVLQPLEETYDLNGLIHALIQTAVHPKVTDEVSSELENSLKQCGSICDQLLGLWEKHYPQSPLDTGAYALNQLDLEQEVIYHYFLEPLWQIWKKPILRDATHPLEKHLHQLLFFKRAIEANTL